MFVKLSKNNLHFKKHLLTLVFIYKNYTIFYSIMHYLGKIFLQIKFK